MLNNLTTPQQPLQQQQRCCCAMAPLARRRRIAAVSAVRHVDAPLQQPTPTTRPATKPAAAAAAAAAAVVAASALLALPPPPPAQAVVAEAVVAEAAAPAPPSSPYQEGKVLVLGPTDEGRVRPCTSANPNCVSTSSLTALYAPAWAAAAATPAEAARQLERAVLGGGALDGASLLRAAGGLPGGAVYRAFGVPSLFGTDVVEFVIRPDGPQQQLVTYRSMAGSVRYVWPIQQPVGDFDTQRKRMGLIKALLGAGWRTIGCDVIECFS